MVQVSDEGIDYGSADYEAGHSDGYDTCKTVRADLAQRLTQAQAEIAAKDAENSRLFKAVLDHKVEIAALEASNAALRERCERLQAVADRIQKRHSEWQEAIANWTGVLSMTKAQAEAAAAEMEWADFLIRSKANHDG